MRRASRLDPERSLLAVCAISAVGDTTDLAAGLALAKLGVDSSKVTFLPTGGSSSRLAALTAGRVDGTVLSEPTVTVATL